MRYLLIACAFIGALLIFGWVADDEMDPETYISRYEPEATEDRVREIEESYENSEGPSTFQLLAGLALVTPAGILYAMSRRRNT
jgi:hypothetical protein